MRSGNRHLSAPVGSSLKKATVVVVAEPGDAAAGFAAAAAGFGPSGVEGAGVSALEVGDAGSDDDESAAAAAAAVREDVAGVVVGVDVVVVVDVADFVASPTEVSGAALCLLDGDWGRAEVGARHGADGRMIAKSAVAIVGYVEEGPKMDGAIVVDDFVDPKGFEKDGQRGWATGKGSRGARDLGFAVEADGTLVDGDGKVGDLRRGEEVGWGEEVGEGSTAARVPAAGAAVVGVAAVAFVAVVDAAGAAKDEY